MKIRWSAVARWGIFYPLTFVLCLELALRILGWGTAYVDDYSIKTSPKHAFVGHKTLGIQLNPGTYQITVNDSVTFRATHGVENERLLPNGPEKANADLLLLGCSFTYGYGVNDDENFAALLQEAFPALVVKNAGVIGYGTVQSLLQLQEAVKTDTLKAVVLNFSSYHFMRNGLSQTYRANLKVGYQRSSSSVEALMSEARFPYLSALNSEIRFQPWESMYAHWKGSDRSAIVNWLQIAADRKKDAAIDELAIAQYLIEQIAAICKAHNIAFGLVCLDSSAETETLRNMLGTVNWLNAGFDFTDTTLTNLPYDSHPSAEGHRYIASKAQPFIKALLNER